MKRFILFACVFALLSYAVPPILRAQNLENFPNYVVIGAFAHHKNALNFTREANQHHFPARFEMNPNRNLYYVFVLTTDDREYAMSEALKLRTETKYFDTWVFSGPLGEVTLAGNHQSQDFNPVTGKRMETVNVDQKASARETGGTTRGLPSGDQEKKEIQHRTDAPRRQGEMDTSGLVSAAADTPLSANSPVSLTVRAQEKQSTNAEMNVTGPMPASEKDAVEEKPPAREFPKKANTAPLTAEEVIGKNFYFQLYRADNNEWVEGEVDAIDFEKSRKMATYPANAPVKVIMPSGKSKQISFVCQVFGYRKQQIEFDPANPSPDIFLDENGNLVVPFELVRLQKGDIAIMYNVFFFKDAAVMRPESRYEVNNLLDLLNENPSYNIRIHGHTNGNASGKIIRMDNTENFYSLAGTKEGFGSARKLSEERALLIRQFLVSSGISGERMEVKAWGGKKPIHDKHSVRAVENVRVEIEILSD